MFMTRVPPIVTRTDPLFPYATRFSAPVGRPPRMGRRLGERAAQISLGGLPKRQLRLAHRTRRRLAALHPWRRPRTLLFDRRGSARQGRSLARARALARTARPAREDRKSTRLNSSH